METLPTCSTCTKQFEIPASEQDFLVKSDFPNPKKCFECRHQERIAWRNERSLYHRTCEHCKKEIIACYSEASPIHVYCNACWWGTSFDPYVYGRDFDFNRTFFEQFSELEHSIPHFALFQDPASENCQYTNFGVANKSCYMALCFICENVYYSHGAIQSKDCMDVTKVQQCELCYECVDCTSCTRLQFSQNCSQCYDSAFLMNCRNCNNCFASMNLNNKQYMWMNEQLTKEEYEKRMASVVFTPESIQKMQETLEQLSKQSIHRSYFGINNNNSIGDYMGNCDNVYFCFDGMQLKDSAFCDFTGANSHNLFDCTYGGIDSALCYQSMGFTNFNNVAFLIAGRNLYDSLYSQYCYSSHHLLGSIGITHGEYVIFNKRYKPEEYETMKNKIIQHMQKTGEWGEFFPMSYSPHAYNETLANEYYPLEEEEVLKLNLRWKTPSVEKNNKTGISMQQCHECNHPFQIIHQELSFYEKMSLPSPQYCPDCRHRRRFLLRRPRKLWQRACHRCKNMMNTAFSPESPEIIYCEKCYSETFYQ